MLVFTAGLGALLTPGCFRPWKADDPPPVAKAAEEGADSARRGPGGSSYHPLPRVEEAPTAVVNSVPIEQNDSPTADRESTPTGTGSAPEKASAEATKRAPAITLEPITPPEAPVVSALRALLDKRPAEALECLKAYDKANQEMLLCLLPLAVRLTEGGLQQPQPAELAALLEQLRILERPLAERSALTIDKMCLCRKIESYGVYERIPDDGAFVAGAGEQAGDLVQVYVELGNFACKQQGNGFETCLASMLEIRDYRGNLVWRRDFPAQPDRSRSPRHDYFINYRFCVPPHVPPGSYVLWVQVKDLTGQPGKDAPDFRTARRSVDFRVRANGTDRGPWGGPGVALKSGEADHDHRKQGDGDKP
jgi:hypothetical protein